MSGTKFGGLKAAETNKKKYGDNFYAEIGRKGGKACTTKGFGAMSPEKRRLAGAKGGHISRRGPSKNTKGKPIVPKENLNASSDFVEHTYKKKFKWPWSK